MHERAYRIRNLPADQFPSQVRMIMQEDKDEESYEDKQRKEEFLKKLKEIIKRSDNQQEANDPKEDASGSSANK
jgi:hypothetical protein